jgi:hypothetical protein
MQSIRVIVLWVLLGVQVAFGQLLLLQQTDSGSAQRFSSQIEIALSDWFFEQGIFVLSEPNPVEYVNLELAQYTAKQLGVKAFMLWSLDTQGSFSLSVYSLNGQLLAVAKEQVDFADAGLLVRLMGSLDVILKQSMRELGLL